MILRMAKFCEEMDKYLKACMQHLQREVKVSDISAIFLLREVGEIFSKELPMIKADDWIHLIDEALMKRFEYLQRPLLLPAVSFSFDTHKKRRKTTDSTGKKSFHSPELFVSSEIGNVENSFAANVMNCLRDTFAKIQMKSLVRITMTCIFRNISKFFQYMFYHPIIIYAVALCQGEKYLQRFPRKHSPTTSIFSDRNEKLLDN